MIYTEEINQSIETHSEMTHMIELAEKNIQSYYKYIPYIQQRHIKINHVKQQHGRYFKRPKSSFRVETTISEMKNTIHVTNGRLYTYDKKKINKT